MSSSSFINKVLPSCLNGQEPCTKYHTKGLDTSCAAYFSHLKYLVGPVTTHDPSSKGHNQPINSLAFIGSKKMLRVKAIEILQMVCKIWKFVFPWGDECLIYWMEPIISLQISQLMAIHLYHLFEALALRVFDLRFNKMMGYVFSEGVEEIFGSHLTKSLIKGMTIEITDWFWSSWETRAGLDMEERVWDGLQLTVSVIM